jgi:hypothetical protein
MLRITVALSNKISISDGKSLCVFMEFSICEKRKKKLKVIDDNNTNYRNVQYLGLFALRIFFCPYFLQLYPSSGGKAASLVPLFGAVHGTLNLRFTKFFLRRNCKK